MVREHIASMDVTNSEFCHAILRYEQSNQGRAGQSLVVLEKGGEHDDGGEEALLYLKTSRVFYNQYPQSLDVNAGRLPSRKTLLYLIRAE